MKIINKKILYTSGDLQLAYQTHFRKRYPIRSRLLLIIGAISFFIGLFLLVSQKHRFDIEYNNWASWFLLFYGVLIAFLYFFNLKNIGRRMYSKMPEFRSEFEYTYTEESISVKSENTNNNNKWEYYQNSIITKDVIIIYPNRFRFNLFPRKYFTEEEYNQLKNWIVSKIKTKEFK